MIHVPSESIISVPPCPDSDMFGEYTKLVSTKNSMLAVARGKQKICLYSFQRKRNDSINFKGGKDPTIQVMDERDTRETEGTPQLNTPSIKCKILAKNLESAPIRFKHRRVDLGFNHDHFHGDILVGELIQPKCLLLPEARLPPFYRYISGECVLNLTKGKFIKFNF